jgi:glycosyltransferase involved in cell wall biosynthesis
MPTIYTEHNKQERYHGITRRLNRATFSWQNKVIAVSADVAESISKNIGDKVPVQIINNGVNTAFFNRENAVGAKLKEQMNIPAGAVVVGIVSVFRFQKRLKEWVDVFSNAYSKCPSLYGVIVGDGPLKSELAAYIKSKNLEQRILMPGLQTEVKPWYSMMDIFMMTSVFEGLPIALLEAMSMECAIVTTNAGGIKEVVRNEEDGLVEDVDRWKNLSAHVELLAQDEVKRKQLGINARKRVEESFGMKRMVGELEELYSRTVMK